MTNVYRHTPQHTAPLFSAAELVPQLQAVWENKNLPQVIRTEALDFLKNASPSERDERWQARVESFLSQNKSQSRLN